MKHCTLALLLLALVAGVASAQYHDPTYVMGGYGTTSSTYWNGVWVGDANNRTVTHLTPSDQLYYSRSMYMDLDNRRIVLAVEGTTSSSYSSFTRSGIYRVDPNLMAVTTVLSDTLALYTPRRLLINQDGDYVFSCYQRNPVTSRYEYGFLKLNSATNTLSTIMTSVTLGGSSMTAYSVGRNMDTGLYLFNLYSSPSFYYAVLEVDDAGKFSTFGGGPSPSYGWYGYYANMEQDHDTGSIVGHYNRALYELKKGASTRTTLWNLGHAGGFTMQYGSRFDLQSASSKRLVASGYEWKTINGNSYYEPAIFYVDASPPYHVVSVNVDPNNTTGYRYHYIYGFDFFRGRHVQTVKTGAKTWQLRISCPRFAGKSYVAAVSMSGYRPGLTLNDGRKIHLVPDTLTMLSLRGLLKPFVNTGPGILDAGGEAQGSLDFSALPSLGQPMWIAVAVLDPQSPSGIAYLPDTYVFRIP